MSAIEKLLRSGPGEDGAMDDAIARFNEQAADEGLVDVAWAWVEVPIGRLLLAATPAGLVKVSFPTDDDVLEELAAKLSPRVLAAPRRLDDVRRQLDEYFEGRRQHFDVDVDWSLSHGFRRQTLQLLAAEVGYGNVVSYGELARRVGNPKAARAVGSAMNSNPVPIVVPCHRVIGAHGDLVGYGGGLDVKRRLLTLEGAVLA
ncbi:MAG: methylated-DNA--[protein]-cysteine S-methyltransferase [Acidimicrobiales bacterium]